MAFSASFYSPHLTRANGHVFLDVPDQNHCSKSTIVQNPHSHCANHENHGTRVTGNCAR
jgi:hypothetical protein